MTMHSQLQVAEVLFISSLWPGFALVRFKDGKIGYVYGALKESATKPPETEK